LLEADVELLEADVFNVAVDMELSFGMLRRLG
jgi:hypothetical protein